MAASRFNVKRGKTMYLIVGLGNPTKKYEKTRHNLGFDTIDYLADKYDIKVKEKKGNALIGQGFIGTEKVILCKPQTFMNESGISVQEAAKFYNIDPKQIMVVHDDIEMEFGQVKAQLGGGMGGHNGLRSVKQHIGTDQFRRLRVGVGRPDARIQVADYVLGRFSPIEERMLETVLESAVETVLKYMLA